MARDSEEMRKFPSLGEAALGFGLGVAAVTAMYFVEPWGGDSDSGERFVVEAPPAVEKDNIVTLNGNEVYVDLGR